MGTVEQGSSWEDTVYEPGTTEVLTHAKSDVVLRISRPDVSSMESWEEAKKKDVTVSLTVGCYRERMSETQITQLREQYPICEVKFSPNIDVMPWTMEQYMWRADTFASAQMSGELGIYEKKIVVKSYKFGRYKMSIWNDIEKLLESGEVITSDFNMDMVEHELQLKDNMHVIVPVMKDMDSDGNEGIKCQKVRSVD